jgi:hypothetical protein
MKNSPVTTERASRCTFQESDLLTILLMLPLRRLPLVPALGKRAGLIVLHFTDDFGSQTFHLLGVLQEQVELDEFGSRVRDLAQT